VTGSLLALEWVTIGACVLFAAVIVAAFAASLITDWRVAHVPHWQPGGEWYGRTPTPAELAATAPLGTLPASVEAELEKLAAMIPDRPA
jgi:hypothetical protein